MSYQEPNPAAMSWTQGTEEYEDSQDYQDAVWYNSSTDIGYSSPVEAYKPITQISNPRPHLTRDIEVEELHARLRSAPGPTLDELTVKPVVDPQSAEFVYVEHLTSDTQTERNKLMYGSLYTSTQKVPLWGFLTWQEFGDHILAKDRQDAKLIYDELAADSGEMFPQVGMIRFNFWLPKDIAAKTRPGYWAIVVRGPNGRAVVHSVNGQIQISQGLRLGIKNTVTIK